MSIQPKHIKLVLDGQDCKNIYYVDSQHKYDGIKELTDEDITNKQTSDFRLTLKVSPLVNGKQKIVKKTFKFSKLETLRSAIKFVAQHRLSLFESVKSGEYSTKTKQERVSTVKELGEPHWNNPMLKEGTRKVLSAFAGKWIKPINDIPINELTTSHIQKIVDKLLAEGLKPATSMNIRAVLSPMLKGAVMDGIISINPLARVKFPKFDNEVKLNISDSGIKAVIHEIYTYSQEPYRTIFIWLTRGRRLNEVLSMEYRDLDTTNMTYTVRPENNKVRKRMDYGLSSELLDNIIALSDVPLEERSGLIFVARFAGGKISGNGMHTHWKKLIKLADEGRYNDKGKYISKTIPRSDDILSLRIHDIRHMIGNTLVSNGKTLEEVAAVLGHTNTRITQRYSQVRRDVSDRALDDFMSIVRPKENTDV